MKPGASVVPHANKAFPGGEDLSHVAFAIAFVNTRTKCKREVGSVLYDPSQTAHQVWVWCWARLAQLSSAWALGLPPNWTDHRAHGQPFARGDAHGPILGRLPGWVSKSCQGTQISRAGDFIVLSSFPSLCSASSSLRPQDVFLASVPLLYCVQTSCPERWDGALQAELRAHVV